MPDAQGLGEVRPIYRRGDRVLVELPSGYYVLVVQSSEVVAGDVWLYGKGNDFYLPFPARRVVRRLAPGEVFTWPWRK
jgi:hypothetical protein